MIFNKNTLTLHLRITKKCNAHCNYCSSFETIPSKLMTLTDLENSLIFIREKILQLNLGGERNFLSVQYVGGEVLTVPSSYIENFDALIKKIITPLFKDSQVGVQSNLIGNRDKILALTNIFGKNIGTSFEYLTSERKIGTSAENYKKIFFKNQKLLKKINGKNPPSIVVINEKTIDFILDEIKMCNKSNIDINLRPVFSGGIELNTLNSNTLIPLYDKLFDYWFNHSNIIIDPFYSLTKKTIANIEKDMDSLDSLSGCPFQANCITQSLNLEPNGDLYICLDTADSKQLPLGNAIEKRFDIDTFKALQLRQEKLSNDCMQCKYLNQCQGGCLSEALHHTGDIYGKTDYCELWLSVFNNIDNLHKKVGIKKIKEFLSKLENK